MTLQDHSAWDHWFHEFHDGTPVMWLVTKTRFPGSDEDEFVLSPTHPRKFALDFDELDHRHMIVHRFPASSYIEAREQMHERLGWEAPPTHWDDEEIFRASPDVVCEQCGKTYAQHPMCTKPENMTTVGSWDGKPKPYLYRLCNGRLAKL